MTEAGGGRRTGREGSANASVRASYRHRHRGKGKGSGGGVEEEEEEEREEERGKRTGRERPISTEGKASSATDDRRARGPGALTAVTDGTARSKRAYPFGLPRPWINPCHQLMTYCVLCTTRTGSLPS